MPRRRRPKASPLEPQDPIRQFAAVLRESAERDRAEADRVRREREEASRAEREAAARQAALVAASRGLERAIEGVRVARRTGSGVAAADAAWRVAKARLIELETGEPPTWAPTSGAPEHGDGSSR